MSSIKTYTDTLMVGSGNAFENIHYQIDYCYHPAKPSLNDPNFRETPPDEAWLEVVGIRVKNDAKQANWQGGKPFFDILGDEFLDDIVDTIIEEETL